MHTTLAHFVYLGDQGLPKLYQKCLSSFNKLHPYWSIKLWNIQDVNKIINNSKYDFDKYPTFINRYNFIKYHILAEEGGWFVDFDIIWKKSIDQIYKDKINTPIFPDLFVPVRSTPDQNYINIKDNDDMLIYSRPGLFHELLEFINNRQDVDVTKKYEPYGPVSLSMWLHSTDYSKIYLYESEIQENGYYCNHLNSKGWKFI